MMLAAFSVAVLGGLGLVAVGVREVRRDRARAVLIARFREAHAAGGGGRALVAGPVARELPMRTGAIAIDPANPTAVHDCNLHVDPTGDILAHIAPGPGSLTTLAHLGEGNLITITHDDLVDPEVARWFVDAFDRPAHIPGRDEADVVDEGGVLTRFRIAMEPAMRTARLWQLRGHADHGATASRWADLDRWRIDTPTGEYPSPFLVEPEYAAADLAEALLVS